MLKTPAETAVKNPPSALDASDIPADADSILKQHGWLLNRRKN